MKDSYKINFAHSSKQLSSPAFTIVELLVVIVIIGILAAITIISYAGVTVKADAAAIKSELESASKQLALFQTNNDYYPITNDCSTATSSTNICLKLNTKYNYTYTPNKATNPTGYVLYSSYNNTGYNISNTSSLTTTANLAQPSSCPTGFIPVPGSATYNTSGFCVMKYEAKADSNGDGIGDATQTTGYNTWPANTYPISSSRKLVSSAAGYPVANISQTTAITAAANYTADQSGNTIANTHLITEAEWMTIAQNVLSVASNWSGGAVGSGYIYSGHNDNSPATALEASTDDSNGYANTGNTSSSGANQKRTLTLINGEVIWDMAGNVYEWTSGQITGNQPGLTTDSALTWRQWNKTKLLLNNFPTLSTPISMASGSLANINSWTTSNGIGALYSNYNETGLRGFLRGGSWYDGFSAGVLYLFLYCSPATVDNSVGLRVVAPGS